ncbi:MAG: LacI family DNA-binding transcriptional regulator, partial [Microbacterium sp.]
MANETRAKRPTLADVARQSGVSTSTVSYVLNRDPRQTISPATRQRVQAAAAALGCNPPRGGAPGGRGPPHKG